MKEFFWVTAQNPGKAKEESLSLNAHELFVLYTWGRQAPACRGTGCDRILTKSGLSFSRSCPNPHFKG